MSAVDFTAEFLELRTAVKAEDYSKVGPGSPPRPDAFFTYIFSGGVGPRPLDGPPRQASR